MINYDKSEAYLYDFGEKLFPGILSGMYIRYLDRNLDNTDHLPLLVRICERIHMPLPEMHAYLSNFEAPAYKTTNKLVRDSYIYSELLKMFSEFITEYCEKDFIGDIISQPQGEKSDIPLSRAIKQFMVDNTNMMKNRMLCLKSGISPIQILIKYISTSNKFVVYDATPIPFNTLLNGDEGPFGSFVDVISENKDLHCMEPDEDRNLVQLGYLSKIEGTDDFKFTPYNPLVAEYNSVLKPKILCIEKSIIIEGFNTAFMPKPNDISTILGYVCAFPEKCYSTLTNYYERLSMENEWVTYRDARDQLPLNKFAFLTNIVLEAVYSGDIVLSNSRFGYIVCDEINYKMLDNINWEYGINNLTDLMKNGGGGIEFAFNANYKSYTGVDNCEREKYYGLTKES